MTIGLQKKIEFTDNPTSKNVDFLTKKINDEAEGFNSAYSFAFYIHEEIDNIIAGCNGSIVFGSIYTDQLWVDKKYRMQGLATQLMKAVRHYGKESECLISIISTMNFQNAIGFYQKLGYKIDFKQYGYAQNSYCILLKKDL